MDRRDPPALAPAYELALELEAAGVAFDAMAERLGVPIAALPSLLDLAHAKANAPTSKGR